VKFLEEMETGQAAVTGRVARRIARTILSLQIGIIMGYLARNVLGQFDLSLPEPEKGGRLYIVETNLRRIESEMQLDPREFRQWITLHEVTHSFEFQCNDWLRDNLSNSMQEYLATIDWRALSGADFFRKMRENRREIPRDDGLGAGRLISIISTPEQRAVLSRLQAIMSVLEGYSNHVMDRVGKELLPSYEIMKGRFDRRRESKSRAERLFERLIGINLKLQQYRIGQAFVDAVVGQEGIDFLNQVWKNAESMPTLNEVNNPSAWIERIKVPRIY
jgi:coenzyme F420 biosynthesis associated uncharacterized protein